MSFLQVFWFIERLIELYSNKWSIICKEKMINMIKIFIKDSNKFVLCYMDKNVIIKHVTILFQTL
jgi:hypothetical protein